MMQNNVRKQYYRETRNSIRYNERKVRNKINVRRNRRKLKIM